MSTTVYTVIESVKFIEGETIRGVFMSEQEAEQAIEKFGSKDADVFYFVMKETVGEWVTYNNE